MALESVVNAESSSSEFLKQSDTEKLANKFSSGSISKVDGEITQIIKGELEKGLSLKALNIEGRAPLNDIATEIITRLGVTVEDIQDLKTITTARGNDHTNIEATKFLKAVLEKYTKLCKDVDTALENYKNASYKKTYTDDDGKEQKKTITCSSDITVKYDINEANTTKITKSGSKDSDSEFNDEYADFEKAFETAEKYYDSKVKDAIDFYNQNGKGALDTPNASRNALPMSNEEHRPEGVQPDAKMEKGEPDEDGNTTDVYYNPDGSTVTIKRDGDGHVTDHKVRDRDGFTTESYKYDDEGNLTHKNVWSYKKVDGRDNVYEGSYTRYEQDENGEWKSVGESRPGGYSYPVKDENGNITIRNDLNATEPPAAGDVADEKREPVHENYKPTNGGTETSDNSGTPAPGGAGTVSPEEETPIDRSTYTAMDGSNSKELVEKHESFTLKVGDEIHIDQFGGGAYNKYFAPTEETGDYYFEYNDEKGVYYVYDGSGNPVLTNWGENRVLDPKQFLKGSDNPQPGGNLWQNDSGYFDSETLDQYGGRQFGGRK